MFETLSHKIQSVIHELGRRGTLREEDVDAALREIRLALLEADVHFEVVKNMLAQVRQRALDQEFSRALNPSQQVLRIIHEELTQTLGQPADLDLRGAKPRVVMLVGLQGSGKTTTAAKLGRLLRQRGERVMLAAADVHRPAAGDQLVALGDELSIPVFHQQDLTPRRLAAGALEAARNGGASALILDTAGRSQLELPLMEELEAIRADLEPSEVLLVADAMTGQEAVNIALGFQEHVELTGLILTKLDGDARGGAAISMRSVTGLPIKYLGVGESGDALQAFDPERLASRILGMGDVVGLVEQAEAAFDAEMAEQQVERMRRGEFTLEDFALQLEQIRSMGPVGKILELLPLGPVSGMMENVDGEMAERQLARTQAIVRSMTPQERRRPQILNASRKRRIAAGSGTSVQDVNQLLRQHRQMQALVKELGKRGLGGILPRLR